MLIYWTNVAAKTLWLFFFAILKEINILLKGFSFSIIGVNENFEAKKSHMVAAKAAVKLAKILLKLNIIVKGKKSSIPDAVKRKLIIKPVFIVLE